MPAQIVVSVEPTSASAVPPPQTGPAVNAAFLKAVDALDPALAKVLHDSPRYKQFAITPILGQHGRAITKGGEPAQFTVSLLVDRHTAPILAALHSCTEYQIAQTRYRTTGIEVQASSYADLATYADMGRVEWSFYLLTPVGFATGLGDGARREHPWPDPARVFGNLARRWETFAADRPLPASVTTAITDHLETVDGQVRIARHLVEPHQRNPENRFRRGAVGTVTYRLATPEVLPPEARHAVDTLASFAAYAGFGDRTAMGMGHVRPRPVPAPPAGPRPSARPGRPA